MDGNKTRAVAWLMQEEGEKLRCDQGTVSRYGIDGKRLSRFREAGVTTQELSELSADEAGAILCREWSETGLGSYPDGLDYFCFDSVLVCNRGVVLGWIGISLLRRDLLGSGDEEQVASCVREISGERTRLLIEQLAFLRRRRHRTQPGWVKYQSAWTNRVTRVQRRALGLIAQESKELEHVA